MTRAYLSDQLRLLLHLCPLWLRRSARGNVAGAVAVWVVYGMEKRMNGGVAMEWLFGFGFSEKLKEKEKKIKGGRWRARGVGLLVRFGGRCGG